MKHTLQVYRVTTKSGSYDEEIVTHSSDNVCICIYEDGGYWEYDDDAKWLEEWCKNKPLEYSFTEVEIDTDVLFKKS